MKKFYFIAILLFNLVAIAQVGIGTTTPDNSSSLDISAADKGVLIPRVALTSTATAAPVVTPATSLLIYNTDTTGDVTPGYYYWNGTTWIRLQSGNTTDWTTAGNAGTVANTNFIGTTDPIDFVTRTNNTEKTRVTSAGNFGIGTPTPTQKLDVQGGNARINNAFIGDIGFGAGWAGFAHQNLPSTIGYSLLTSSDGNFTFLNKSNTGLGYIGFRVGNTDVATITNAGNMGIGTTAPAYRLDLANGTIGYGNSNSRTETRNNAGQQSTQSGFFETNTPTNFPTGATSWWHLIDSRHSNNGNNYAMQIAGSFFDQDIWFRKTNNNAAQSWSRILTATTGWQTTGNSATNPATNFIGTIDPIDFVARTNNVERMRLTSGGNVGIGIATPSQKFDVQGGNARINNAFIGDVGHGASWAAFAHQNLPSTIGYSILASTDGNYTFINKLNTGSGYIGFRMSNNDVAVINGLGNMGIGTTAPQVNARLQAVGGSIMPQTGNSSFSGIYFPANPGGGGGDEAYIRHYVEAGENTKLVIANLNDSDDDIAIRTGLAAADRINVNGIGTTTINRAVLFDCNDCGSTTAYDIGDGAGANWGDLVIQGRVLSSNSNLHLSPPGGNRVIINSAYRSAGGAVGTTGLDIEDGGIRFRKNYRWINRYGSTAGFGWGSQDWDLGNWDFCAVGGTGFRNTNSATDEDDDTQCVVYPSAHANPSESSLWDSFFTYQFNQRPNWRMYLEGFAETNATNCAAICMNFD